MRVFFCSLGFSIRPFGPIYQRNANAGVVLGCTCLVFVGFVSGRDAAPTYPVTSAAILNAASSSIAGIAWE